MTNKTIAIDSEGYFKMPDGLRFNDEATGSQWLNDLTLDEWGVCSFVHENEKVIVEPFDKPLVAQQFFLDPQPEILLPYNLRRPIYIESFCIDQWDRFHGLTRDNIPFVLTRKAQAELFQLADEFSDDSITLKGQPISTPNFYLTKEEADNESFWTGIYQENPSPPWNLDQAHPSLKNIIPQIKPLKGRMGVLGCGYGHDADYFAEQGHIVSAYDISQTAIDTANEKYQRQNLKFYSQDIFSIHEIHSKNFDYIFEHTLYCALPPERRKELIKHWWHLLDEGGHLMGIFFVDPKRGGPPYGSSEWELQTLLEPYFDFRYWTRLKDSPGWRNGIELFVYAQKRDEVKR